MHKGCGVILFAIALGLSFSALATIYKWVDEDGKVHYSDKPREGAQVLTPNPNTENAIKFSVPHEAQVDDQQPTANNISVQILSPVDQQTLRNNSGDFTVTATVSPRAANTMNVLLMDGQAVGQPQKSSVFNLQGIDRGAHTLKIQVVDGQQRVVATSPEITIFLHRFSKHFN